MSGAAAGGGSAGDRETSWETISATNPPFRVEVSMTAHPPAEVETRTSEPSQLSAQNPAQQCVLGAGPGDLPLSALGQLHNRLFLNFWLIPDTTPLALGENLVSLILHNISTCWETPCA